MDFLVVGLDRPDAGELRQRLRAAHLEFVSERLDRFKFGGPILSSDDRPIGSVLIVSVPDRAALDAHLADDPYFKGDLFEAVFIRKTRQVVPEAAVGALAEEIARESTKR